MKYPLLIAAFALLFSCSKREVTFEEPDWFEFQPDEDFYGSVIDMSEWLDKPAGKHGFVQMQGDDFVFEDGTPVKFWGVNICSARPFTDDETIDQWVGQLSHYGVNGVRFHKFTQHGLSDTYSDRLKDEKWEHFDYFQASLREAGIYYGWSPIYGHKLRPGDKDRLLAYDEIADADMGGHLSYSTIGLVNFAEDIQDLHIDLLVHMLEHENPATGLRYADDPALSFIELQNEDNIWFSTADKMMELCPTYKQVHRDKFCTWLKEKYATQAGLEEAWGEAAFEWGRSVRNEDWNLEECNITPICGHGIYGYEYSKYAAMDSVVPLFLRDHATFLYEEQVAFYDRFAKAIRATGYRGTIVGSCWQAGTGITHYYNLAADRSVGFIDRHNYFGGGTGHRLVPGRMNNKSMMSSPGSGFLSTGRQQVADRPFALSEWMSLPPNEWIAEGPAIVGIYGLGLNDWDASYQFASDYPHFTNMIHTPGVYNVNAPTQLPLYPAISAMIYRNEIKEGEVVHTRYVSIPGLQDGVIGFDESVKQDRDQKEITGMPPNEVFAIGKVELAFTDEFKETTRGRYDKYWDTVNKTITSNTGQLFWDYSGKGYFTLSTEFSAAFAGFTGGKELKAGHVTVAPETPFSVIMVTSSGKETDLDHCNSMIVTAIARAENTGMKFNEDKTELLDPGVQPILLEPVQFSITLDRKIREVRILDHVGKPTGQVVSCRSKRFTVDGARYRTMYYELVF